MKKLIEKGSSVEDILERVKEKYDLREEEFEYNVIERGFPGIFGFLAKDAVVEITLKKTYFERRLREFLEDILKIVDADVRVTVKSSGKAFFVDIDSDRVGRLIGKHGKTLGAIQHIAMIFVNRLSDTKLNVVLDMGEYRKRRRKFIEKIVQEAVAKALKEKTKVVLDPMFAFERRLVHEMVKRYKGVISYSVGVEPYRRVVIEYVNSKREGRRRDDLRESLRGESQDRGDR